MHSTISYRLMANIFVHCIYVISMQKASMVLLKKVLDNNYHLPLPSSKATNLCLINASKTNLNVFILLNSYMHCGHLCHF